MSSIRQNLLLIPYSDIDILVFNLRLFTYLFAIILFIPLNSELVGLCSTIKTFISAEFIKYSANKNFIIFFFFIFTYLINFFGLFPFFFAYTSHFFITLNMALLSYARNVYFKLTKRPIMFFGHTSIALTPLRALTAMASSLLNFIIKIMVITVHIFTIRFRLTINMAAGHLIIGVYSTSIIFLFLFLFYELFAAFIQRFIFFLISNLYYN